MADEEEEQRHLHHHHLQRQQRNATATVATTNGPVAPFQFIVHEQAKSMVAIQVCVAFKESSFFIQSRVNFRKKEKKNISWEIVN